MSAAPTTPPAEPVWSRIAQGRAAARAQLPPLLDLPIVPSHYRFAAESVRDGESVLDVGAHDRRLASHVERCARGAIYRSLDVDPTHPHDYRALSEVERRFDVIAAIEVVEHLPLGEAIALLEGCAALLEPGGRLVVSTPNVDHPTWFWRDPTHRTPLRYTELVGILASAGLADFEVVRVRGMRLRDRLRAWRYRGLLKLLNLDFTHSIAVRAQKPRT
jgi:hypothetical protein